MKKMFSFLSTVLMFLAMSHSVYATPMSFEMGDNSAIDVTGTQEGLSMWATISALVGTQSFNLEEGDSFKFKYATMGTDESWVNKDDLKPQDVTAILDFDVPDVDQSVGGQTVGFTGCLDFEQGWYVTWNDPVYTDFGVGGRFKIELTDAGVENDFWTGPDGTCCHASSADIYATVTLVTAPAPVPEPASLLLLGVGALGLVLRRKK